MVYSLQIDIFQLVGDPLVENCLAGFNSSVFAYGQVTLKLNLLHDLLSLEQLFIIELPILIMWY